MLYNRFAQHVVNDKKKMYKRGSQWVVASAFALAIGGFGVTQAQTVQAAETQPQLTVQSATLVNKTDATTPSSAAVSQTAQAQAATVATSQAAAAAQQKAASTVSAQAAQPASAAARVANAALQTNAPAPSSASMTDEQWKAAKAKYDQAKADAAKSEAAKTNQASADVSSYAASLAEQEKQKQRQDQASLAAASQAAVESLASLKASQAASYAATSQQAQSQIDSLNSERTSSSAAQVSDGGTFNYVAKNGLWTNVVTVNDYKNYKNGSKGWNGNYLVQNLPVFSDSNLNDATSFNGALYPHTDDDTNNNPTPKWSLGDVVENNQLTEAQKLEVNQYAMMLVNNYRRSLGYDSLSSNYDFVKLVQERGNTLMNTSNTGHNSTITDQIFGKPVDETLTSVNDSFMTGLRDNQNHTMLEMFQGVADAIDRLINFDGDSNNGHRHILLGEDAETGFSLQYNTVQKAWIMNSNGSYYTYGGENTATVPAYDPDQHTTDNNKEIDQKIQQVKDNLQSLKTSQDQAYQARQSELSQSVQQLADKFSSEESAMKTDDASKLSQFKASQNKALADFISELNQKVEALKPGPEPTPSSNSSSSASSAGSSATSSAGSSAGSSAASSATSAGSSAASSAASSANSSSASSTASSATSSAASSAASSASSSAASSAASSATSSTASSAASSASSSATSNANSSVASSATGPAASAPAGSNTPKTKTPATAPAKPATVTPLVKTEPTNTQPLSRMTQKYGKHAYPATGESQNGIVLAEAGALIIAVLGFAGVRKYRHAK
ncbi:SEC10/PgrA surface exclusion domain-containing protein [Lacticaseibacillus zeae]|uniref:SEC10/PgrA surface exclusion domain-containing protein n=1 Tax=Lacticaseibacillus zeae TaxID=57037 RepID=A0A5R8LWI8_LACZE|nr:SEC10/PgrA surface exclusion domain-containing protein [Lacticaseibacillus zeae]TLF41657.1 SEC10/PgrA surface exclusion domain-containing protein [Lacticaseibacillus zeae]